jgi:hypothetical protein
MTHGTEQHLEHAEHAKHAAHDPFDKRVAMTMAMIAAVLALVSTLSHRRHNQVLQLQGEAIRYQSEATGFHAQASNQWNYFQQKKQRMYLYGAQADLLVALANLQASGKVAQRQPDEVFHPVSTTRENQDSRKETGKAAQDAKKRKAAKKAKKAPTEPRPLAAWWKGLAADYNIEAKDLQKKAEKLQHQAEQKENEAETMLHDSHHVHAQADRLDMGHLGLELALVLCSVAVLSKQRGFWFIGSVIAAVGACVSFTSYIPFLM